MKLPLTIAILVIAAGCFGDHRPSPTSPRPPGPTPNLQGSTTFLVAMVVRQGGGCIMGATVQVVRGEQVGSSQTQTRPCDVWSDAEVVFHDLTPGVEMTLRAAAPGYVAQEKTVMTTAGEQQPHFFTLQAE